MQKSERVTDEMVKALRDELKTFKPDDVLRAALTAALSSAEEKAVEVEKLNWRKPDQRNSLSRAETDLGVYRAWTHFEANGRWFWSLDGYEKFSGECKSEEAAKAAAQQDYETRIRSALVDVPAVEEPVASYFARQIEWSRETFGPALRTKGVIDHIRKELAEIEREPHDLSEWIDVVILAMDGFWRHGGKAEELMPALLAKQRKNMARVWPDWRMMSEDSAIEHDRSHDAHPPRSSLIQSEEGWRPIKTAPMDKTRVIIAVPTKDRDGWIVGEASFDPEHYEGGDWWWANLGYSDYHAGPISDCNHHAPEFWQPLPTPPSPYGGDNGDGAAPGTSGNADG